MGEEAGNDGAHALARKGFSSDLTLVLEPTQLGVVTAHKGALWLEIATTGVACHGSMPEKDATPFTRCGAYSKSSRKKSFPVCPGKPTRNWAARR